jgi:ABC-type branched-subunit amino acid transport system substrate-binding protein
MDNILALPEEEQAMNTTRRRALAAGGALLSALALPGPLRAQGKPLRIGSTLPLTGPLASLAIIHKVTAEICVENLNKRGGLLGRPVEWVLRDDQSKPELTRTLYEQLITADKVDLIQSPYATASILAAMGVAQRYGKVLLHTSFGIPKLAKYDMQFQTAGSAFDPENVWPNLIFDAAAKLPKPPKTVAVVTSKFPSVHHITVGAREVMKKRGLQEVLHVEYEFGNRDYGAIASRIKEANPDFLWGGTNGIDPVLMLEAMKKIDYRPPAQAHLFPAPGPMLKMPEAQGSLALTNFEAHPPLTDDLRRARQGRRHPLHRSRPAIGDHVRGVAGARGRGNGDQGHRRQGDRGVAEEKRGEDPVRHPAVERPAELRRGRGPVQDKAAAAGPVGRRAPGAVGRAGGEARLSRAGA